MISYRLGTFNRPAVRRPLAEPPIRTYVRLRRGFLYQLLIRSEQAVKLIVTILQDQDANKVVEALVAHGFPGPTRISTVGGFLRRGNATLLLGTEDERVEQAAEVIREAVEASMPVSAQGEDPRRATIFLLDAARFIRI